MAKITRKEGSGRKRLGSRQEDSWLFFHMSLPEGYEEMTEEEVIFLLAKSFTFSTIDGVIDHPDKVREELLEEHNCDLAGVINNVDSRPGAHPTVSIASERLMEWYEQNSDQTKLWDFPANILSCFYPHLSCDLSC